MYREYIKIGFDQMTFSCRRNGKLLKYPNSILDTFNDIGKLPKSDSKKIHNRKVTEPFLVNKLINYDIPLRVQEILPKLY